VEKAMLMHISKGRSYLIKYALYLLFSQLSAVLLHVAVKLKYVLLYVFEDEGQLIVHPHHFLQLYYVGML
jgi:hypothetical protein